MKRKALRVRSDGSIPPYVTEAESRKQHSDSPLCNSLTDTKVERHMCRSTHRLFTLERKTGLKPATLSLEG